MDCVEPWWKFIRSLVLRLRRYVPVRIQRPPVVGVAEVTANVANYFSSLRHAITNDLRSLQKSLSSATGGASISTRDGATTVKILDDDSPIEVHCDPG